MAAPVPDPGTIIYLKDWLTLVALVTGPVLAVWWTLHHQDMKEKRAAQERLFITLMAHRKAIPVPPEWAQSLNVVDVVYANHPKVAEKYHLLYNLLDSHPVDPTKLQYSRMELLSEMAAALGYKHLQQTDIDKFYLPQGHTDLAGRQFELQTELIRVLKASKNLAEGKPDKS